MTKEQESYNRDCCNTFGEAIDRICEKTGAEFTLSTDFENEDHVIGVLSFELEEENLQIQLHFCPMEIYIVITQNSDEKVNIGYKTPFALQNLRCTSPSKKYIVIDREIDDEPLCNLFLRDKKSVQSIEWFISVVAESFTGPFVERHNEETGETWTENDYFSPLSDILESLNDCEINIENSLSLLQLNAEEMEVNYNSRNFSMLPYILYYRDTEIFRNLLKVGALQDISAIECYIYDHTAGIIDNLGSSIGNAFKRGAGFLGSLMEVGMAAGSKFLGSIASEAVDNRSVLILTDVNVIIANKNHIEVFGRDEWELSIEAQRDDTMAGAVDIYLNGELFIDNAAEKDWTQFLSLARKELATMQRQKQGVPMIANNMVQETPIVDDDPMAALTKLKKMLEAGLIEQSDFDEKKKEILGRL